MRLEGYCFHSIDWEKTVSMLTILNELSPAISTVHRFWSAIFIRNQCIPTIIMTILNELSPAISTVHRFWSAIFIRKLHL
jgi:hypothetical protein